MLSYQWQRGRKYAIEASSNASIRVLLADDHAVVRAGIRQFLERAADIRVIAEADDGEQAREMIDTHLPDVAVLDIQMPGMSGIEVTRWARQKFPQLGILILTAYTDDPYVLAVLQAGANGYVLKTASPAEIIRAVKDVYAGKSVVDAVVAQKLITHIRQPGEWGEVEPLTEREMEVLRLTARGYANKAIAIQLNISDRTVQGHLAHIFNKLNAESRTEAVMRAVALGWIPPNLSTKKDRD